MSNRTATVNARIDPEVKKAAEEVLDKVGLSASDAINVFYRQIVYANGLPFEVKASKAGAPIELNTDNWNKEQLLSEIDKGINSLDSGKGHPAREFFAEMREKYGI
ncbi:type II toxin-antitoxin system RelB/DinJ family antitoxin [Candidatus Saccharibacteria bacterium]|nr:type II toxin-antitoxin system RelB/DinJ family antitoxin [Candidatus Saccharibacteria bacterium]